MGTKVLRFYAVDSAGNQEEPKTETYQLTYTASNSNMPNPRVKLISYNVYGYTSYPYSGYSVLFQTRDNLPGFLYVLLAPSISWVFDNNISFSRAVNTAQMVMHFMWYPTPFTDLVFFYSPVDLGPTVPALSITPGLTISWLPIVNLRSYVGI